MVRVKAKIIERPRGGTEKQAKNRPTSTLRLFVSRFGLAVRRLPGQQRRDLGSSLLRLTFLFKSCGLWTLSCDFVPHNETLNWLVIAAHLNAGVILVVTDSVSIGIYHNLPLFSPPYPLLTILAPSLISLVVPVDAKHHVRVLVVSQPGLNQVDPQTLNQRYYSNIHCLWVDLKAWGRESAATANSKCSRWCVGWDVVPQAYC